MIAACSNPNAVQRSREFCWPGDDALRIAALKLLHVSGYTSLRSLRCDVAETVVIVTGVVHSFYLKQMVQTLLQRLDGIQSVMNLVEVRETDSHPGWENDEDEPSSEAREVGPHHSRVRH